MNKADFSNKIQFNKCHNLFSKNYFVLLSFYNKANNIYIKKVHNVSINISDSDNKLP